MELETTFLSNFLVQSLTKGDVTWSTDVHWCMKAVVLVWFLVCVTLCCSQRVSFQLSLTLLSVLVFFSVLFRIVITSLGEERACIRASRVFMAFVCLFYTR